MTCRVVACSFIFFDLLGPDGTVAVVAMAAADGKKRRKKDKKTDDLPEGCMN